MNHSKKIFISVSFWLIILLSIVVRLFWLDRFPPSLYTDEIDQGYNAYSVLKTGRDEHGVFLPISFRSFGDWKPPLPTYLMTPFILIFGLTENSVRLPSAILGVATIALTFFLVRELFWGQKGRDFIALLACFFLSISPWHILQSRSAMLVAVGLFFLEGGIYFFLKAINKAKFFYLAAIFFALSIYSYYGLRVVTPLIMAVLIFYWRKNLISLWRKIFFPVILGLILLTPLIYSFIKSPNVIFGRAKTVSIFYDQGVKLRQWELIAQDGTAANPSISRLFHNIFYMYGKSVIQRFLSHFDGRFLFIIGDQSPPFQIPNMGILYFLDLIFIISGIILLSREKRKEKLLIFLWLFISFIPAAFTFMTPSSNRTFNAIIPFVILISFGLLYLLRTTSKRLLLSVFISLLYGLGFTYFLRQYFQVLPLKHADFWNYGWKEVVTTVKTLGADYGNIIVSDVAGMPYVYFLFYNQYSPDQYQKEAVRTYISDRFGFEHVEGFDKYWFPNDFDWKYVKENKQSNTIYVVPAKQAPLETEYIKAVYFPDGQIAFKIFTYE